MLTDFRAKWNDYVVRLYVAKRWIVLIEDTTKPVHSAPYCAGMRTREFEIVEINKMLAQNVFEPAQTEWSAQIVFAPKENDTMRFRVDYRKLNALLKQNPYPIP